MDDRNDTKKESGFVRSARSFLNGLKHFLLLVLIAVAVLGTLYIIHALRSNSLGIFSSDTRNAGIMQVKEMKEIGEWEFLSIEDEELVDTVKKGFLSDDYLVRIYYGTLRLGFNMEEVPDDWVRLDRGTLYVTLPAIRLLDERFIDEARTKAFFESGKWSDQDRIDMYSRAYEKMVARCLTDENLKSAEENATREFLRLLRALGYDDIRITYK